MLPRKQFYKSTHELTEFCHDLKQIPCPHCRQRGALILHGYLVGYGEKADEKIRGRRFFCSNRQHRHGCGRTFSLLAAGLLRCFSIAAPTLWCFMRGLALGLPSLIAFKATKTPLHIHAARRILRRVERAQTRLRSILLRHFPIPEPPDREQPIAQTVNHLQTAFPSASCPITAFQNILQVPFL